MPCAFIKDCAFSILAFLSARLIGFAFSVSGFSDDSDGIEAVPLASALEEAFAATESAGDSASPAPANFKKCRLSMKFTCRVYYFFLNGFFKLRSYYRFFLMHKAVYNPIA
jgi:hypothetical protein